MTVASSTEIGCRYCGAVPGEACMNRKGKTIPTEHAIRRADSQLDEALPGWEPSDPTAEVIDFEAARRRRAAERNGVIL